MYSLVVVITWLWESRPGKCSIDQRIGNSKDGERDAALRASVVRDTEAEAHNSLDVQEFSQSVTKDCKEHQSSDKDCPQSLATTFERCSWPYSLTLFWYICSTKYSKHNRECEVDVTACWILGNMPSYEDPASLLHWVWGKCFGFLSWFGKQNSHGTSILLHQELQQ